MLLSSGVQHEAQTRETKGGSACAPLPLANAVRSLEKPARHIQGALCRTRQTHNGSNNGKIGYSVRQAAEDLQVCTDTASKHFQILTERGFIEPMKKGAFSLKERHATEWRMTEFTCDVTGKPPTKDFMRWQPAPKIQNTVLKFPTDGPNKQTSTVLINGPEDEIPPSYGRKI